MKSTDPAPKVLFTFAEAAEITSLPETWLRKRVTARTIPHRRLGKHVRFAQADLDEVVRQAAEPAATPIRRRTA